MRDRGASLRRIVYQIISVLLFACLAANTALFAIYDNDQDRRVGLAFYVLLTPLFLCFVFLALRTKTTRVVTPDRLPCPRCGYNLRGMKEARCPECGGEFTLEELVSSSAPAPAAGVDRDVGERDDAAGAT